MNIEEKFKVGDGGYNVKPKAHRSKYRLGAAKAFAADLVKEGASLKTFKEFKTGLKDA